MLRQIHKIDRRGRQQNQRLRTEIDHQAGPDGEQLHCGLRCPLEPGLLRESGTVALPLHAQKH